jgi:enterochelin esterase family protein
MRTIIRKVVAAAMVAASLGIHAQFGPPGPQFSSPEVTSEKKVTFRIHAPKAEAVRLSTGDIPNQPRGGAELSKGENGVWEVSVGPVAPGAYRYHFNVDGVATIDPKNPATSESNANTWSLVQVPGAEFTDVQNVPHGAVAEVHYYSQTLKRHRRMHVYTPPGYEAGQGRYPVFYLLHGAFDSDDSWTTVGRAGVILDNLIAAKKAKPMILVMPAGHTGPFGFGRPDGLRSAVEEFVKDFNNDVMPYVEKTYRVHADRAHRAIAGLSMGGAQTLSIAVPQLEKFAHVGVYSSGIFGLAGGPNNAPPDRSFLENNKEALENAEWKKGLKHFWFATGKEDFLLRTTQATVDALKEHKFDVIYHETEGAHTWIVWREYLRDFAPLLF